MADKKITALTASTALSTDDFKSKSRAVDGFSVDEIKTMKINIYFLTIK